MIKKSLFSIAASLLLLFMIPVEAVNMDPESHLMFSRPQYAKHIDVQCYIVNREQLRAVFNSTEPDSNITQLTNNQLLKSNEIYLFVKVRNRGNYIPFGRLNCFIPHVEEPFPVEVLKMFFKNKYCDYAFRLDHSVIDTNNQKPTLSYKWENLYCL
ncbi:MAG: hypothetical protein KFB95_00885 [Simkaniaceae bacterium]|nr:MAG: hypothetical protein KFB95_00885 [Simkaniaceae bacterium]